MASSHNLLHQLFLIISTLLLSTATAATPSGTFLLPIIKDAAKLQYYTTFLVGTPSVHVNLVVDLANAFSWFACDISGYTASSTYKPVRCNARLCSASDSLGCISCSGPAKPSCNNHTCGAVAYSRWSDGLYSAGLIKDSVTVFNGYDKPTRVPNYPFTCADAGPLKNLSQHAKGILTLARTHVALHSTVSLALRVPHKFALCLPSSTASTPGAVYFGGGPYNLPSTVGLVTTPMITNPNSTAPIYTVGDPSFEYFVKLTGIEVQGVNVRLNSSLLSFDGDGNGGTKISTIDPYTVLHSDIYSALVGVFVGRAKVSGMERVAGTGGFGVCFRSTGKGAVVPVVDLVFANKLQGKNARWRIYGENLMTVVAKGVECLALVDGGIGVRTAVVIGGKWLEDNLVEFDLAKREISVSSSLLRFGTSCALHS